MNVRNRARGAWFVGMAVLMGSASPADARRTETIEALSPVYTVDRIYRSMQGPMSTQKLYIPQEGAASELVWIRGYRAVMVGEDGRTPASQDFMCHSNLDVRWGDYNSALPTNHLASTRLFTLSQGQAWIRFPEGYGIPMVSGQPLSLTTQVLNLNVEGKAFKVRHKVTLEVVRDRKLKRPMKPLFGAAAFGLQLVEGDKPFFGVKEPDPSAHGAGCLFGQSASQDNRTDAWGRKFTGHWIVKPGREENHTLATRLLKLPFDTTVHFIAVHLHPFAESIELRDLTAGTSVFKSRARNYSDRIGLSRVDAFSSRKGLPLFKNHEYEIVSVYNNTSGVDQDSMAVMYLYLHDRKFMKPGQD